MSLSSKWEVCLHYALLFLWLICIWPSRCSCWWKSTNKGTVSGMLMIGCQFAPTHVSSFILFWYLSTGVEIFKHQVFLLDKEGFHSELAQWVVSWVEAKPSATSVLIFTVECTPCYINIIYACTLNKMTPYLFNGNSEGDREMASHMTKRGLFIWSKALSSCLELGF